MDIQYIVTELRKKGLTQSAISVAIGCSQPTVCDIESGKIGKERPSYKIVSGLKSLASQYEVQLQPAPPPDSRVGERREVERRIEEGA